MPFQSSSKLRRFVMVAGLGLIPAALLGVHFLLQNEFATVRELRTTVDQTVRTREDLTQLLALHLDLETGSRGYALTGDEAFLEPYNDAYQERQKLIDALRSHLERDRRSKALLDDLSKSSDRKFAFVRQVVSEVRAGRRDDAAALVATGQGKIAMDDVRQSIAALDSLERDHLEAVSRAGAGARADVERIITALLIALALLLAIIALVVGRAARERSEALFRARRLSERETALFHGAVDGMLLLDGDGNILRLNPSIVRMFGYTEAELIGRHNTELMDDPFDMATSQAWLDRVGQAGIHGAGRRQEFTGKRRDGSTFATEVAISRVSEVPDRRFVAAIRDISDFKRAEQMKNEFVSTVSHELRTPLTSIAGSLGLLSGGAVGQLNEKATRLLAIAHSNCERLIRLINDMLDIEKIESGKMHFAEGEVDVGALVDWTLSANRAFGEGQNVQLVARPPERRVFVLGDADRLEQLLTNLVSNAIKHSPEGETVEVAVTTSGSRVRIDVLDRGSGVPQAFRERIFGKFAMADSSDTRTRGGTGLGLSIAREIAQRHGGSLSFHDRDGGGTIFRADLPVLERDAGEPVAKQGLPVLLHVDDDRDCLSVVASAFEGRADVVRAANGTEARKLIAAERFAGAIIDIGLRDENGGDLVPLLRRRDPTMPVVLFSAIDDPHQSIGADAVLIKSRASIQDLVEETMRLLAEKGRAAP
jgi:PAS domain S-box-containing protein